MNDLRQTRLAPSAGRGAREGARTFIALALTLAPASAFADSSGAPDLTLTTADLPRPETTLARMLTPLAAESARRRLATEGVGLASSIDPPRERLTLFVPRAAPAGGYGLLVFIPPGDAPTVPSGWASELERQGLIFVAAARSGNAQSVLGRRVPLALATVAAVGRRYRLDPHRIYVGGFSGGARVALRVALAYPDVFAGALLDAGSDPLGKPPVSLPNPERLDQVRQSSRLVLLSGAADASALGADEATARSLTDWCVRGWTRLVAPFGGHTIAPAASLTRALAALDRAPPERDPACERARAAEVAAALDRAEALLASGEAPAARRDLLTIDGAYGGFAGSRLTELADRCACGVLPTRARSKP